MKPNSASPTAAPNKVDPVISDVYPANGYSISVANNRMPVSAVVTDDKDVFQCIFQIDPEGKTWEAPNKKNIAFWQVVDFYKQGKYEFTAHIDGIGVGPHKLRVTAYDMDRNEATSEITFHVVEPA